ncbi:MAG TPA: ELWxxDGT repeat protein [Herpetosiphonaceae bacterium]
MNRVRLAMGWMLLTALALGAAPTRAQQPGSQQGGPAALVKDINPAPGVSGWPGGLVAFGGSAFFTADDGQHGAELWKTDGTAAGTVLIKDINPAGSGVISYTQLLVSGGALYFGADDGQHGRELWRTDGTEAGTALVKDINPGAADGYLYGTDFYGTPIFIADDGVHGSELWRSDGTEAGTALVQEIHPGPDAGWQARPSGFAAANGWLYFSADDGQHGRELWRTDGFSATTTLVRDIRPGAEGSNPEELLYVEGKLHFAAADGTQTYSKALWTTDGTAAGTIKRNALPVGAAGDQAIDLFNIGGKLYYSSSSSARFTCGFHGPAIDMVLSACPSQSGIAQAYGRVFFTTGGWMRTNQLWTTDGTDAGTSLFRQQPAETYIAELTEAKGWLFYSGNDGQHGQELWQSAGTPAGTAMIQDINPGAGDSHPYQFTLVGDRLIFTADDGTHGSELWSLPLGPRWAHRLWAPLLDR